MPMFIVTYDVRRITPNPSTTLVAKAEALGWASWMLNSAGTVRHRLPTATLIGEFESMEEAKRAFDAAVAPRWFSASARGWRRNRSLAVNGHMLQPERWHPIPLPSPFNSARASCGEGIRPVRAGWQ